MLDADADLDRADRSRLVDGDLRVGHGPIGQVRRPVGREGPREGAVQLAFQPAADAVADAHAVGIVHRDEVAPGLERRAVTHAQHQVAAGREDRGVLVVVRRIRQVRQLLAADEDLQRQGRIHVGDRDGHLAGIGRDIDDLVLDEAPVHAPLHEGRTEIVGQETQVEPVDPADIPAGVVGRGEEPGADAGEAHEVHQRSRPVRARTAGKRPLAEVVVGDDDIGAVVVPEDLPMVVQDSEAPRMRQVAQEVAEVLVGESHPRCHGPDLARDDADG